MGRARKKKVATTTTFSKVMKAVYIDPPELRGLRNIVMADREFEDQCPMCGRFYYHERFEWECLCHDEIPF
jgi:hypothetical protein